VPTCPPIFCAKFPPQPRPSLFVRSIQRFAQVAGGRFKVEVNSRDTDSGSSFHLPLLALHQIPPVPFHFPPAPFHWPPGLSTTGFVGDWLGNSHIVYRQGLCWVRLQK
jgi:hypothetical protein